MFHLFDSARFDIDRVCIDSIESRSIDRNFQQQSNQIYDRNQDEMRTVSIDDSDSVGRVRYCLVYVDMCPVVQDRLELISTNIHEIRVQLLIEVHWTELLEDRSTWLNDYRMFENLT
jgi:hypothetical protein